MPIRILVVDDEPSMGSLIERIFLEEVEQGAFQFQFASHGLNALAKLEADWNYDIIITDLKMPVMDGLELLARLKEISPKYNPFLVPLVMSAYDDMKNIRKAMNYGGYDFLTKPIDYQDLRITVQKAIEHSQQLRHAYEREQRTQEALQKAKEELEQRVVERTADLVRANESLQIINSELDAFAHTVAHDLKSPLSILMGYVHVLRNELEELQIDHKAIDESINHIERGGQRAVNIVDELLLLASVRKDEVQLSPVDMAKVVEEVLQRLSYLIVEYNASVHLPPNWPLALGYGPWLEEVWANYISNALKYGGTPAQLELGATPFGERAIKFWIRDNGKGLSKEDQALLFAEFTRLDELRVEGHGLGLSIVKRIIDKLGGTVGVESELGRGSLFYFVLPAA